MQFVFTVYQCDSYRGSEY